MAAEQAARFRSSSTCACKTLDGLHELLALGGRFHGISRSERVGHTVVDVIVEDLEGQALERRVHSCDLREDVDAVAVVLDHPFDAAHLTFDPVQALDERVLVLRVAVGVRLGDLGHVVAPWSVWRALLKRLRRRLLLTTNREEAAIAAAAMI